MNTMNNFTLHVTYITCNPAKIGPLCVRVSLLSLFRPGGGGGAGSASTLGVNNFFNIKAKATKLGEFFQNLSGNNLICHVAVHVT